MGYIRCFLTLLRSGMVLVFFYNSLFFLDPVTGRMMPIIMAIIYAYASFNFLMLLKCLFENVEMRFP
jgi:hypothetical protein